MNIGKLYVVRNHIYILCLGDYIFFKELLHFIYFDVVVKIKIRYA